MAGNSVGVLTLGEPDGKCSDLPEGATTMWDEKLMFCPNNVFHKITGSTRKVYCAECNVWWKRPELKL